MSLRSETIRAEIEQAVPALRRFARALLAKPQTQQIASSAPLVADDLVHETVLLALRSDRMQDSSRPIRMALYSSLIGFHAAQLKQASLFSPSSLGGQDSGPMGDQGLIEALDHLALEDRVVFLLISLEQMSYDEVAEILHISRDLVVQRLVRARNHLARSMPGQGSTQSAHPHLRLVK